MPRTHIPFLTGASIYFDDEQNIITFENPQDVSQPLEIFDLNQKPEFRNETGEIVFELSGLAAPDHRADRSWALARYEKNGYSMLHYHTERTEDYYVTAGQALVVLDGKKHLLSTGESITIPPHLNHQVFSVGEKKLEMLVRCEPSWIFGDQHFVTEDITKKKSLMSSFDATEARHAFIAEHPAEIDDKKVPNFYESICYQFNFPEVAKNKKIAFIVVAHRVHTLPYFLEAVTQLGPVAAIIPKGSTCVQSVINTLKRIYASVWRPDINKDSLRDPLQVYAFMADLIINFPDYQFIILDHGGYFAPYLEDLFPLAGKLEGIIEHTWNGEMKYAKAIEKPYTALPFPLFSIARTRLKAREDDYVASSIVDTLKTEIFGGAGLSLDMTHLSTIGIIGYGHIGRKVALALRFATKNAVHILVCDTDESAREYAASDGFQAFATADPLIAASTLIVTATNSFALTAQQFEKMQPDTCIACVTSRDDQFSSEAFSAYEKVDHITAQAIAVYEHKSLKKKIRLAADGGSVNFLTGSTPHPILHAVLASVCASVLPCLSSKAQGPQPVEIQFISENEMCEIEKLHKGYFGSSTFQTDTFGFYTSSRPFLGRKAELRRLGRVLYHQGMGVISQNITGSGGVGKTALAKEYARQALSDRSYDYIILLDASSAQKLYEGFCALGKQLRIKTCDQMKPTELLREIYKSLKYYTQILIVFDNVENYATLQNALLLSEVVNFLPPAVSGQLAHYVITTQNSNLQSFSEEQNIRLGNLDAKSAVDLIKSYLPHISEADAFLLAKTLDFYPLALCQSAAYLQQNPTCSVATYVRNFTDARPQQRIYLESLTLAPENHLNTLYATWDIAIKQAANENPVAEYLLNMLAYLESGKIPMAFIQHMVPLVFKLETVVVQALAVLEKYCLIDLEKDANEKIVNVSMHTLGQTVARLRQEELHLSSALTNVFEVVYSYANGLGNDIFSFIPHALSVIGHHEKHLQDKDCLKKFRLLLTIASSQHFQLFFSEDAHKSYLRAQRILERERQHNKSLVEYHLELYLGLANSSGGKGDPIEFVRSLDALMDSPDLSVDHVSTALQHRGIVLEEGMLPLLQAALNPLFIEFRKDALFQVLLSVGQFDVVVVYYIFQGKFEAARAAAKNAYHQFSLSGTPFQKISGAYFYILTELFFGNSPHDAENVLSSALASQKITPHIDMIWNDQLQLLLGLVHILKGNLAKGTGVHFSLLDETTRGNNILSGESGFINRIKALKSVIDHLETYPAFKGNKNPCCQAYRLIGRFFNILSINPALQDLEHEAMTCFTKALTYNPDCPITHYEYGCFLLRKNDFMRAIDEFEIVVGMIDEQTHPYWYAMREWDILPEFARNIFLQSPALYKDLQAPLQFWVHFFAVYLDYKRANYTDAKNRLPLLWDTLLLPETAANVLSPLIFALEEEVLFTEQLKVLHQLPTHQEDTPEERRIKSYEKHVLQTILLAMNDPEVSLDMQLMFMEKIMRDLQRISNDLSGKPLIRTPRMDAAQRGGAPGQRLQVTTSSTQSKVPVTAFSSLFHPAPLPLPPTPAETRDTQDKREAIKLPAGPGQLR